MKATDAQWKKLHDSKTAVQETVKAGVCEVTFINSAKNDFYVMLSEKAAYSRLMLDRKQANGLISHLKKSTAMVKHVDKIMDAALSAK